MADIERMFRSELAVLAEQQASSDLWALDAEFPPVPATPFDDGGTHWDTTLDVAPEHYPHGDSALGLFPAPNRRLGGPTTPEPFTAPQQTVHLSDLSLGISAPMPMPMPVPVLTPPGATVQIPLSTPSSGVPSTDSPTDSLVPTDPSSEDMDSDDLDLVYPSDSEYLPSPIGVDPASLTGPSSAAIIRPSRRAPRAMTKVPIPIPNLTKKSRGRKVPTSNGEPIYAASRDKTKKGVRNYTCPAHGCGKCFVRGEHLKRHIRSIHTEEKPWICTYENCSRTFSRQDNLNQHLRVHKLQGDDE